MTQLVGVGLPELLAPLPHRLVGDSHSPLVQEFFDISEAKLSMPLEGHRISPTAGSPQCIIDVSHQ